MLTKSIITILAILLFSQIAYASNVKMIDDDTAWIKHRFAGFNAPENQLTIDKKIKYEWDNVRFVPVMVKNKNGIEQCKGKYGRLITEIFIGQTPLKDLIKGSKTMKIKCYNGEIIDRT